ncbi:MAG TPA: Ig-like domain-containing protein, partial [Streptosporangiaceae bacterium]|nr:Ig-like domain-containing protein [Streptosporangiaceae bacterium]
MLAAAVVLGTGIAIPAASFADNPSGCDFAATGTTQSCSGPLTGSTFAGGDGNLLASPTTFGTTDWQNVAGLHAGFDQPSGTGDNSFGQGTKEDNAAVTVVSGSIPPNKSDLTRFYEASEIGSNNHNFLFLAWERSNVLGSANMDFEINQATTPGLGSPGPHTINRTAGDLLVTYDFTNGGGKPTLGLLFWVTTGSTSQCFSSNSLPCWGNHVTLNGSDSIGAVNNLGSVNDPLFPGSPNYINPVPALQFGETAIDLTAAGVFPPGTCEAFGSAFIKSRASASFGAEVKDFIAPVPVNISNCGSIKIIKHTDPRGQDQVFSYTSNLPAEPAGTVGGVAQGGVKCPGNSSAGVQADGSFCLNDAGNSNSDSAGNTVFNNALQSGTYHVTEGADPSGFTFESLSCTGNTTTTTNGKTATIGLAPGDAVVCTYVNQQNTATLATQVSDAGPVFPSSPVHDTATVTGNQAADTPSGTVTFFLCGPIASGSCSSGGTNVGTGTLSGSGATASANSPDVNTTASPLTPGRYCFRAEWPGDNNYPAALSEFGGSGGTNECFTVQQIATTTTTTPKSSASPITFGSQVTDHAIVQAVTSGDGTPTGTVTFFICNPSQLSGGNCATGGTQVGSDVTTAAV